MQIGNQSSPWSRRRFLGTSLLASASALGLQRIAEACDLTTPDTLGPYWIRNAPFRTVLASPDEPGTRLFIDGRVFATDCATELEGTIVDVWQASDAGCYSVVQQCGDEDPFNLRGQMITGADGEYGYETVLPGYYPGRCRHIHLRIVPPKGSPLVTQLYFEGDPRIPDDPFASDPAAAGRIIPLTQDGNGALHGVFDMNIAENPATVEDETELLPTATRLYPCYPNPVRDVATVRYQLARPATIDLAVFDASGRRVRTLEAGPKEAGYYTSAWNGKNEMGVTVGSGAYALRLGAPSLSRSCRVVVMR